MRRPLAITAASLAATAAGLGLIPAVAAAATPPVRATTRLVLDNVFTVAGNTVTVPGRAVEVQGTVTPYVPGQHVSVLATVGAQRFKTDRLAIKPAQGGRIGRFTETLRSPATGIVRVRVTHTRSARLAGFLAQRAYSALAEGTGFGARGLLVDLIQQRLSALHVYVPLTGVYDTQTGLALDAYHRLIGAGVAQTADPATIADLLNGVGAFHVRFPGDGKHIEGDLHTQLLAEIYGSKVHRIYPISSGKPSTPTILGRFKVYLRDPGYLPDGMYFSSFFSGGYAIHGYNPAPDYPASHGCMRVPIIDAISIYDWLRLGDRVDTYL